MHVILRPYFYCLMSTKSKFYYLKSYYTVRIARKLCYIEEIFIDAHTHTNKIQTQR